MPGVSTLGTRISARLAEASNTDAGRVFILAPPLLMHYVWRAIEQASRIAETFGDGSAPTSWAVVSDQGGKAEVAKTCSVYGGPFCIYPWYTLGTNGFPMEWTTRTIAKTSAKRTCSPRRGCVVVRSDQLDVLCEHHR